VETPVDMTSWLSALTQVQRSLLRERGANNSNCLAVCVTAADFAATYSGVYHPESQRCI